MTKYNIHIDGFHRAKVEREINPRPEKPKTPAPVTIWRDVNHNAINVSLSGIVLLDETGRPAHIGPTRDGPARWDTAEAALAYFQHVNDVFRSL